MSQKFQQQSIISKVPMAMAYLFRFEFLLLSGLFIIGCLFGISILPILPSHPTAGWKSLLMFKTSWIIIAVTFAGYLSFCFSKAIQIMYGEEDNENYFFHDDISFPLVCQFIFEIGMLVFILIYIFSYGLFSLFLLLGGQSAQILLLYYFVLVYLSIGFFLPAITMIFGGSQSFQDAINPLAWFAYIQAVGVGRYCMMIAVLFLSLLVYIISLVPINYVFGGWLSSVLSWYSLALFIGFNFTFMGYCSRVDVVESKKSSETDEDLRLAEETWEDGYHEDALQSLLIVFNKTNDWAKKKRVFQRVLSYHETLGEMDKRDALVMETITDVALKDGRGYQCIRPHLYKMMKNGTALSPELIHPLAELAFRFNDAKLAVKLTSGFAKKHPHHPDIADNLFVSAKAFEYLKSYQQAYKILAHLIKNYPNYNNIADVKSLFLSVKRRLRN